jgi:segregation and condensation protein A
MTYKVDLDIYNGPMDLLLYLIRREEVDVRDIPLARIADQYLAYLDLLKGLDIELAGDFVVMAATLLELKSRALLPRPPELEEGEEEDFEDPRETLIRQLIEYRRFKEAAALLDDRGREMARRFPRQVDEHLFDAIGPDEDPGPPAEMFQGLEVWDLISAFTQVIRTLGYSKPGEVIYDDTPIEEAATDLLARLEKERSVLFTQLFAKARALNYALTMFLAILELIRQRKIGVEQAADFKDFRVFLRDPAAEPPPKPITPKGARQSSDALHRHHPRRPSAHQVGSLREMMEDADIEKTEFDEILDSIQIPEVEAFHPMYSQDELMGKKDAPEGDAAAPPPEGTAEAPVADATGGGPPPAGEDASEAQPPEPPEAGTADNPNMEP